MSHQDHKSCDIILLVMIVAIGLGTLILGVLVLTGVDVTHHPHL